MAARESTQRDVAAGDILRPWPRATSRWCSACNAGQADEAFRAHWDPGAALYFPEGFPEPGPWIGLDAIIAEFHRLREDFGEQHLTVSDVVEGNGWVVNRTVWHVRADRSGVEGEFVLGVAFRLVAGRVVEARYFWDYADALDAAGLPPRAG